MNNSVDEDMISRSKLSSFRHRASMVVQIADEESRQISTKLSTLMEQPICDKTTPFLRSRNSSQESHECPTEGKIDYNSRSLPPTSSASSSKVDSDNDRNRRRSKSVELPLYAAFVKGLRSIGSHGNLRSIVVNNRHYSILNLLGKGGSSQVFQVYDQTSQSCLALKCVHLKDADQSARSAYENEIHLLRKLQNSNRVVKLYDYEKRPDDLLVVMEKGDTDLATFLKSRRSEPMSDKWITFYWAEMLQCVFVIHKHGIVHSDLKPSNFLLVGGNLKLIDFGIASTIPSNKTAVTKDCQMGTLSYISPEAIDNAPQSTTNDHQLGRYKIPLKSDVWSLGCILYNMVYGKTPFQHIGHTFAKMMAIVDPKVRICFPKVDDPLVVDVMQVH